MGRVEVPGGPTGPQLHVPRLETEPEGVHGRLRNQADLFGAASANHQTFGLGGDCYREDGEQGARVAGSERGVANEVRWRGSV